MGAFITEYPGGAGRQSRKQSPRAQKVHVGEGAKEEQAFDAGGKAGQVQQETALVVGVIDAREPCDFINPALAELRLAAYRGDILDGREGLRAPFRIAD